MSKIPADRRYTKSHEWALRQNDDIVVVGISDHAQEALGDLVFVDPPAVGRKLAAEEACAVVESVKAASDVYSPLAGEVVEVNSALSDQPELLNEDPYDAGWVWKMKVANPSDWNALLDAAAYTSLLENEE